ncbi:phage holin family protein [Candidatus Uhrbacteria bacterium]|nr:phage holin family protein [Candidatus Uhrbacteria bacterium]
MLQIILRLILSALGVMLVAYLVPGIAVASFWIALIAAIIIGVVNALIRPLLQLIALPITILTLGLFSLIVNAACFGLAAWLVPGFSVSGFGPAFWGALAFALYGWLVNMLVTDGD